jgi:hypothetical protein
MRLHEEEKPESVEKVSGGLIQPYKYPTSRPATTWCQTNLSKSVEVPFTPINTPIMMKVDTPHSFGSSPLAGEALLGVES